MGGDVLCLAVLITNHAGAFYIHWRGLSAHDESPVRRELHS